jgi:hypothetical protein
MLRGHRIQLWQVYWHCFLVDEDKFRLIPNRLCRLDISSNSMRRELTAYNGTRASRDPHQPFFRNLNSSDSVVKWLRIKWLQMLASGKYTTIAVGWRHIVQGQNSHMLIQCIGCGHFTNSLARGNESRIKFCSVFFRSSIMNLLAKFEVCDWVLNLHCLNIFWYWYELFFIIIQFFLIAFHLNWLGYSNPKLNASDDCID